ncbi:MAG: hypothetical protein SPI29_03650 [Bacteroides uniformis]|nr:hypothetical protein [Bacteroides uniformis]
MELKIYNRSGELKLTVSTSSSSTWNQELMKEYSVSVSFTHPSYVMLDVEDYVLLEGVKFSIKKEYKPRQKDTQTYSYSVKFYAPIHDAEQVKYLHLTDGAYNPQFSLDGGPREHLQKWVENMNRIYGREVWSIGDVVVADNRTIEYNNVTCWDAATMIAEAFGTEWWTDGFTFNLSRCEHGEPVELGYMRGLTSLVQSENSDSVKFFTRLIPLGSTKNIDPSRYGFSRLQLPDRSKYVDRNTNYGLYEHVEEDAFAGIFPHYTGSVTAVRSEEKTGDDGNRFTVYYFKDSGMQFDPNGNEIAGLVKHVSFQTGDLAGRDFEANYDSKTREWEIINTYPDDKTQIPGGSLIPAVGNEYIPWNFRMPVEYETQAELDYKAAVDDYLARYSEDVSKYGGDTDYIYIDRNRIPLLPGQRVRLLSDKYFSASGGTRDTRMTKVVRKLDNLSIATIECTNQVGKGWKSRVDSSLTDLKYILDKQREQLSLDILKSWDGRPATDNTVMSALRVLKEIAQKALSKTEPDQTDFLIRLLGGLEVGDSIDSMVAGKGIIADRDGRMQLSRLEVRDSLTVLELIFNRLSAMESDYSFSESGTIESVSQLEDGTYSLKMKKRWDNDFTALAENDVVYGVVNDLTSGSGHYYTSWLRVLHVDASANTINAVMYPDSEVPGGKNYPPEPLMILSHRGNPVDTERQGYWYLSSREHCICMLNGVTKPVLEESNYSVIVGRLKHLSLFDNLPINYLHSYIYVRGLVAQDIHRIDFQGVLPRIANDRGEWSMETATGAEPYQADREAQTETVRVMMYDTVWHYGCKWMCLVSGTTDEPQYGSASWAMIEGNPDFSIDIESSNGWYFDAERFATTLTITGELYNRDVTAHILDSDVEWTRDTGNVTEDNAWAVAHAETGKSLPLTVNDLGPNYMNMTGCKFIARVLLRDGQNNYETMNYITF